jgi:signal transduction histidine kinase
VTVAAVLAVAALVSSRHAHFRFAEPLALLATVPVALIRRRPAVSLGLVLAANAGFVLFGRLSWPVAAMVAWLIALAGCPILLSRSGAVVAFAATEAAAIGAVFIPSRINATPWDASVAEVLAVVCAVGAGTFVRAQRQAAAGRAAVTEQVRDLAERDVRARERAGIARELHDVIAHHVSMIAVRAATAPYAIGDLAPLARSEFEEIAGQARIALAELRAVLGVLRADDGAVDRMPQPRLGDVPSLLDRMRSAGMMVALRTAGRARPLPESVELCGYRIVQEALTNVGRHAPGSQVVVELLYTPYALRVTITDDGAGSPLAAVERGNASSATGFGLVGMRERVITLGGEFDAGRDQAGGFRVTAWLPAPSSPDRQHVPSPTVC